MPEKTPLQRLVDDLARELGSYAAVHKRLGIADSQVSRIRRGLVSAPNARTLDRICAALGIEPAYFAEGNEHHWHEFRRAAVSQGDRALELDDWGEAHAPDLLKQREALYAEAERLRREEEDGTLSQVEIDAFRARVLKLYNAGSSPVTIEIVMRYLILHSR